MTRGRIVVVTGTSTDVGKTVATAALAATIAASGRTVVVVKPVQTGVAHDEVGDAEIVHDLAGVRVHAQEFVALPEPLAPETAARLAGVALPPVAEHADRVRLLTDFYDVVLVEGAGGLLVRMDTDGGTLLDLATDLDVTHTVEVMVVCSAGLGTLNHTELTVDALRDRGLTSIGLVIGSWPAEPGLAESCNRDDLPRLTGAPVLAALPEGAGRLTSEEFVVRAPLWFGAQPAAADLSPAEDALTST